MSKKGCGKPKRPSEIGFQTASFDCLMLENRANPIIRYVCANPNSRTVPSCCGARGRFSPKRWSALPEPAIAPTMRRRHRLPYQTASRAFSGMRPLLHRCRSAKPRRLPECLGATVCLPQAKYGGRYRTKSPRNTARRYGFRRLRPAWFAAPVWFAAAKRPPRAAHSARATSPGQG